MGELEVLPIQWENEINSDTDFRTVRCKAKSVVFSVDLKLKIQASVGKGLG